MHSINLPRGAVKACAGIVECARNEPYLSAVEQAGQAVGRTYAPAAEPARLRLLTAVKLNLINRKEYPIETLRAQYGFFESNGQFKREKKQFCAELVRRLSL